jgi:cytochrome o ubiquinol oxidase operon protein cyoD
MTPVQERRRELRSYVTGLLLALLLTAVPFASVAWADLSHAALMSLIGLCAAAQIIVHLRFFLHIDLSRSHRDDLQLIFFSAVIILLMVGGTLWIMSDLSQRMG